MPVLLLMSLNKSLNNDIMIDRDNFTIGRSCGCQFLLDNAFVSKIHFRIRFSMPDGSQLPDGQAFFIDDLSRNGTFLNNEKIGNESAKPIKPGDIIHILRACEDTQDKYFSFKAKFPPLKWGLLLRSLNPEYNDIEVNDEPFDLGSATHCDVCITLLILEPV
mmetsp:Transcript_26428/g.69456  ORF Transcript_26428/g.69456 Transcript_26428/m.69456 type:complete len:162 (-) Transcript_26428:316-801(-)